MTDRIYVWDRLVRVFHWTLVLAFLTSYLTGDELETVHVYSGYLILSLLVIRIIWGFIGTPYARFSQFVRPFPEAVAYVKGLMRGNSRHYTGHNPAGGLMVIALLISLSLTGFSGLKLYGLEGHGPLAIDQPLSLQSMPESSVDESRQTDHDYAHSHEDNDEDSHEIDEDESKEGDEHEQDEEFWEELHEFFANLTVLLVIIHIGGVFFSSIAHGENLVRSMINGYKTPED